jgi:hypothetical protein
MGDTGLEVAPGPLLRPYAACLLLSGALRSAEIRSLKYHGKYHGESFPDETYFPRSMNSARRENLRYGVRELEQVGIA